ncbi:teicoplanin resistance protein VanZ [Ureibacillus massiliensis 4400831 = CIP 108448 = CCUG 49529]|uniref:Teicoplanin resistance protein VanZ n=1 Tax=Ureibacillus massiliensis 4400831 = CIP 108448 = CCUG 49529 TaxID=1211035 RepID=A0A0A3J586_9BACL|nr:VanZ family protein [Ureibacillus massiliensis]KGR90870.1 teicoplanin resistance protein VanZ [Ureibacillus massiliensis 4400831 = CIP 108448 = CCUG 49529]
MTKNIKLSFYYSQILFFILLPIWIELTKYLHPIVIGVVWFCITFAFLFGVCWIKKETIRLPKAFLHIFIVLYSFGLLILLFFRPNGASYGGVSLIPFDTISFYLSGNVNFFIALYNLAANIGLFVPYGLYYRYLNGVSSWKRLMLITVISISMIECLQFSTKRGSLDIDDLILNVLGVLLGYLIYPLFEKVFAVE